MFPCDEPRPATSTLNHVAGETIANSFVAKIGGDGRVCIYSHATAHLVVDVNGQFERPTFQPLRPARLLDSRWGHETVDGRDEGIGRRTAGSVVAVDVTGRGGTAHDAAAVALNVTVTGASGHGHLTVFPCGSARPSASTINYGPGDTIANAVIAKVGDGGAVCIFTHAATHLVVDVAGHVPSSGSSFRPLVPARLADTRPAVPASPDELAAVSSLARLNALRAAYGVAPLRLDGSMSALALGWSQEMSRSGFRHSGMAGYAENIAWHSASSLSPDTAADRLHQLWVDSPPHFAAMIDPRYTKVGIGLHRSSSSGWYGTHLFAP
ncbi:MAG: CAP domain-containing protein [Ilumatobacter sp.]|nr:CAP domain-containing protein [Ilumatobacter sp.]